MTTVDAILAPLAIIALAVFLSVLVIFVPEPALIVVLVATILMAAYDFFTEFRIARQNDMEKR